MKSLKDYILDNIDQVLIFSRYLNISETDIHACINYKSKISFRDEVKPSLSFKYFGNKLICNDFGDPYLKGDVFEVVGYVLNLNCRKSQDFIKICTHILNNSSSTINRTNANKADSIKDPTEIDISIRSFQERDYRYFYQYYIDRNTVINNYQPVSNYAINGFASHYKFTAEDPCYAYQNNPGKLKLYFPLRSKRFVRFITNNTIPIELINTVRNKKYTVLIKAFKDKLFMDYVCQLLNITDIQFLPVASESARLPDDILNILKSVSYKVFTLFDMDACGIESANYYKVNYNIDNISLNNDATSKDPTDLVNKIKLKLFLKMFKEIYECF